MARIDRSALTRLAWWAAGALHWAWLLRFGRLDFTQEDWPKELAYLEALRQILTSRTSVDHAPLVAGLAPYNTILDAHGRFLANPEVLLSPHALLLHWMAPGDFVLLHVEVLFAIGFLGLARLGRGLGPVAFGTLAAFFVGCGYLESHLWAGHLMWSSALLLPWVVVGVLEGRPWIVGLTLAVIGAQGGFHVLTWGAGLFVVSGVVRKAWRDIAKGLALAAGLLAYRYVPTCFTYDHTTESFLGGYTSPGAMLEALVSLHDPPFQSPDSGMTLRWHEYDAYVGIIGLVWLAWFGLARGRLFEEHGAKLAVPVLGMLACTLSPVALSLGFGWIPIVGIERIPSRMIFLPLLVLAVLAARATDRALLERPHIPRALPWSLLALGCLAPLSHTALWRLPLGPPSADSLASSAVLDTSRVDPAYDAAADAGAAITLGTVLWCGALLTQRFRRRAAPTRDACPCT